MYKDEWSRLSPLFKDDTFGPVTTRPDDDFVLLGDGRFRELPVARDLGDVYEEFQPGVSMCMYIYNTIYVSFDCHVAAKRTWNSPFTI